MTVTAFWCFFKKTEEMGRPKPVDARNPLSNAAPRRRKRTDTSSNISLDCFRHPERRGLFIPQTSTRCQKRKRQILRERIIDRGQQYLSRYSVDVGASHLSIDRSTLKILDVFPIRKADLFELSTSKRRDIKIACEAIDTISQIASHLISVFSVNNITLGTKPMNRLR
jgi:hypothetical protein